MLDADQEGAVEVAAAAGERRLVGEDAEDLIPSTCEALRDRVRGVARDPDGVEYALAGLLGDSDADRGVPVQDEAHGRLADTGHRGDVGLGEAVTRHRSSSICWIPVERMGLTTGR